MKITENKEEEEQELKKEFREKDRTSKKKEGMERGKRCYIYVRYMGRE